MAVSHAIHDQIAGWRQATSFGGKCLMVEELRAKFYISLGKSRSIPNRCQ